MKTRATIVILISVLFVQQSVGQKIKYKDLFPTLEAKNWAEGGPSLWAFLADPKNIDFPNANLQVGLMLEERFLKQDVVADTAALYSSGDSAILYLNKAKSLITEKELKKNDKYYQSFFRRDLRTGEFGIKVSDVHLDIEKKVEVIEKRIADTRSLHGKINSIEDNHKKAKDNYEKLTKDYPNYSSLLLGADSDALNLLQEIKTSASAAQSDAADVKELARTLKTDKYQGEVVLKPVGEFGKDGLELANIHGGQIELWNYEEWAFDTNSEINGSVGLLKSMVMSYSTTVREKKKLIENSQDTEVDTLSQELISLFDKYEPNSVVRKLLQAEVSEVLIKKQVDISINQPLQDSTLIGAQLEIFEGALAEANKMSIVLESIDLSEMNQAKRNYPDYINSFFQTDGTASNFVTEKRKWVNRQKAWLSDAVEFWSDKNKWGIDEEYEGGKIPLFLQDAPETKFFTVGVPVSSNEEIILYGAELDQKKGYVYSFAADRYAGWKIEYDLPGSNNYQLNADTIPSTDGSISFFMLNSAVEKDNLSVVSFTTTGTLNWNTVVTVPKAPVDFKFDEITQELTILLYPEDQLPLDNDELGYIVIDRTGSAR